MQIHPPIWGMGTSFYKYKYSACSSYCSITGHFGETGPDSGFSDTCEANGVTADLHWHFSELNLHQIITVLEGEFHSSAVSLHNQQSVTQIAEG